LFVLDVQAQSKVDLIFNDNKYNNLLMMIYKSRIRLLYTRQVECATVVLIGVHVGQAEVSQLQHPATVDHTISRFQIAMVFYLRMVNVPHSL
jgi:hypothetical protein